MLQAGLAVLIASLTVTSLADYHTAWLDSLHVCRNRGHRRQECSKQGSLFSSPIWTVPHLTYR
jgi:hypothetical protein